jgi:hypothetical protein
MQDGSTINVFYREQSSSPITLKHGGIDLGKFPNERTFRSFRRFPQISLSVSELPTIRSPFEYGNRKHIYIPPKKQKSGSRNTNTSHTSLEAMHNTDKIFSLSRKMKKLCKSSMTQINEEVSSTRKAITDHRESVDRSNHAKMTSNMQNIITPLVRSQALLSGERKLHNCMLAKPTLYSF